MDNNFNNISTIKPNIPKALMLARRQLSELVCDAVNLENINFTLPEIQTLLDGVSLGGRKLSDQQVALNQAEGWKFIFTSVESGTFNLSQKFVCACHAIAAFQEALEWGRFRSGLVTIAGTDYCPPEAGKLENLWKNLELNFDLKNLNKNNIYDQAIGIFLEMARTQFFYDVNKRMGRFLMNGFLLSQGYPVINLPAKRQLEFNQKMLDFYESNNKTPMIDFMKSCLDPRIIKIMSE